MSLVIRIRSINKGFEWEEDYDPENLLALDNQGGRKAVRTLLDATKWAEELIERFNDTCMPHESKRKLIKVEFKE